MKPETIKEKALTVLVPLVGAGLGFEASPFVREMWDYVAGAILPKLSPRGTLSILATLTTICLLQCFYIRSLGRTPLTLKYKFDAEHNYHLHPKSGVPICTKCLSEKSLPVPLGNDPDGDGLSCAACGNLYSAKGSRVG